MDNEKILRGTFNENGKKTVCLRKIYGGKKDGFIKNN
jgi:hypothetical protein